MKLTAQQITFFNTFGYLHLPGALKDDIGWITDGFEQVMTGLKVDHAGVKRTSAVPFIDQHERLCTLVEHPVIEGAVESLLGPDYNYCAGDGNYYVGDTQWHSDGWWSGSPRFIKVAFYLDPLTRNTGALRVIPGSHVVHDTFAQSIGAVSNSASLFGVPGNEVPAVALETQPGDLAIFNHNTKHASFGGSQRRRMFTLNIGEHCKNEQEIEALRKYLGIHITTWSPTTFSELMLRTANPRRMRHLQQVLDNQDHLPALYEQKHPQQAVAQ